MERDDDYDEDCAGRYKIRGLTAEGMWLKCGDIEVRNDGINSSIR